MSWETSPLCGTRRLEGGGIILMSLRPERQLGEEDHLSRQLWRAFPGVVRESSGGIGNSILKQVAQRHRRTQMTETFV